MNTYITIKRLVWLWIAMLVLTGSVLPIRAEDRLVEGAMILAPGPDRTGEVWDDTLEACLARIPERVTPEQPLTVQQQCHEDETARQLEPRVQRKGTHIGVDDDDLGASDLGLVLRNPR